MCLRRILKKNADELDKLTQSWNKIHETKQAITEWDILIQLHEASSLVSSPVTIPTESSSEHAQILLQYMINQVDHAS